MMLMLWSFWNGRTLSQSMSTTSNLVRIRGVLSKLRLNSSLLVKKFGVFNTNNIWINMNGKALDPSNNTSYLKKHSIKGRVRSRMYGLGHLQHLETDRFQPLCAWSMFYIIMLYWGIHTPQCQLRTSAGSAIKFFKRARGVSVPRTRYLPVKNCSDLLLVKSSIYELQDSCISVNRGRMFRTMPVVKLGDRFKNVNLQVYYRLHHLTALYRSKSLSVGFNTSPIFWSWITSLLREMYISGGISYSEGLSSVRSRHTEAASLTDLI